MGSKSSRQLSLDGVIGSMKLDAYQRSAQLYPAILTVLAPLVVILLWLPSEMKLVSGLLSLAASAALTALLMQIGRAKGRAIQARLTAKHGGLESTIGLRHRDTHVAGPSRQRYHAFLMSQGLRIPTAAEEIADPVEADECYRAAADWLREHTRDPKKFALLQGENRTYGFRRNLRGMKPIGLTLTLIALAANALALWFLHQGHDQLFAGGLLGVLLIVGLLAWVFVVTDAFVDDASWAYTVRLLAACDTLAAARKSTGGKKGAGKPTRS